jgi:hypothetical protein
MATMTANSMEGQTMERRKAHSVDMPAGAGHASRDTIRGDLPDAPRAACWHARSRLARHMLVLIALCAVSSLGIAKPFEFDSPVRVNGGMSGGGHAVAIGDANGDGRDDIVVSEGDNRVIFRLQGGSGTLEAPKIHPLDVSSVRYIRIVDIDRDGITEVLVGHARGVGVYAHQTGWRYIQAIDDCEVMAVADIDLDGWIDAACLGWTGNVSLYFNDRMGAFHAPTSLSTPAYDGDILQIRLKDVTGDGYPDLVAMGGGTPGFYVHPNDRSGGFFPAHGYFHAGLPDGPLSGGGFEIFDVDNDGLDEIVTTSNCNTTCARLHIHRRDKATGLFRYSPAEDIATHELPIAPVAYDVDRDGRLDLMVPHRGWSTVGRYMGGASGLSRQEVRASVHVDAINDGGLALGDFNGDGCTDMAVANSFGMHVLKGICGGAAGSDYNGDGASDVFWRNAVTGDNLHWRSGDAAQTQSAAAVADVGWRIAGQGDFDGDGRSDLLWRHGGTGANVVWRSANLATQVALTGVTDVRWQVAGVGDFDGDGLADILWCHATTGANAIWRSGNHATQQSVTGVTDVRWQVVGIGDFNGDGRSDILWRHATTGGNAIWSGGNRAAPIAVTGVTDVRWRVAGVGDFNRDGRADLFWRHSASGANVIWLGASHATQKAVTGVSNLAWNVAAIGDYNADGTSDILWRHAGTGANVIWRSADMATQTPVAALAGHAWSVARP